MADKHEIVLFLREFKQKISTYCGVIYLNSRPKNIQTLADLEIMPGKRDEVLNKLEVINYSEGPVKDQFGFGGDMWIFGYELKGNEIYIKITLGKPGRKVVCISFHISEHPMVYPFKEKL